MGFDYQMATEEDIVRMASQLRGQRLGNLSDFAFKTSSPVSGKAEVGHAVQKFFGMPRDNRKAPDFEGAGIELKIVPVTKDSRGKYVVKERTFVSLINFKEIVGEEWETSHVRAKLTVLFVFVDVDPGKPKEDFLILGSLLWRPSEEEEMFLREDWESIREKVAGGKAHELSEAEGFFAGAAPKGKDSRDLVEQPVPGAPPAMRRGFALKSSFVKRLFQRHVLNQPSAHSAMSSLGVSSPSQLLPEVIQRFEAFRGMSLRDIADSIGITLSSAKSGAAGLVRLAAGAETARTPIEEFESMGLKLKTVPVDAGGRPYESTSFPSFKHMGLIEEEWESSSLLAEIQGGLIFVPLVRTTRGSPSENAIVAQPVLWRPTENQLRGIEQEWRMYRDLVGRGKAAELPGAAATTYIHVRPKARNRDDTDLAPVVGPVTKKAFWLNSAFVRQLIGHPVV